MAKTPTARAEMSGTRSLIMNGEIILYGVIDPFSFGEFDSSIRAIDVMASLTELSASKEISVRINSPGGSVIEGLAIYNLLKACGKPVTVHIDAMAASIASIIAMAGDTIVMAEGASIMIHDPWGVAIGRSEELRKNADEIDRLKAILVDIYAKRTGCDPDEITAMMSVETYMSADECIERGFATHAAEPMKIAACAQLTKHDLARLIAPVNHRAGNGSTPAAPAASIKETIMEPKTVSDAGGTAAPVVNEAAIRAEASAAERTRVSTILAFARTARVEDAFVQNLITSGTPAPEAQTAIINKWSDTQNAREDNPSTGQQPASIEVRADAVDRWAQGAERGLMIRSGLVKAEASDQGNEFIGLTLSELARSSLTVRNIKTGSDSRLNMVGKAFTVRNAAGMHSTSDFPQILQNVAYRAVMKGYTEVEETFDIWTGKGSASDFRPISRVDMGLFPALDKVEEGAEYKFATIGDSGTVVQVATYGKMFAITRQAIINDDLQFFQRVPEKMGRAAKRTIGNLVYAVLNGNPTMQDGNALFSTPHANNAAVAAVPSVVSMAAAMTAMALQKDDQGNGTAIGIKPKYVITPAALWLPTKLALTSANYPGDAGQIMNPVAGMFEPLYDARLSGTAWFAVADPMQTDTIEVTYLDGNEEPFLDQKDGWSTDGTEFKVRLDAGVKALHWRGLYRNTGV